MQNTPPDSGVKRENGCRDYSRLDHITEVTVFLPIGTGTDMMVHKISTRFLERHTGKLTSEFFEELVEEGSLQPVDADAGFFCPPPEPWCRLSEMEQASRAMSAFNNLTEMIITNDGGVA